MIENRPLEYDHLKFTLPTSQTDYDVKSEQSALFSNVPVAKNVVIFHNQEISIRFNSTLMPLAILPISRSPFQSPNRWLETNNIYLTNTTAATIEIWLW